MRGILKKLLIVTFVLQILNCQKAPEEVVLQTIRVKGYGHFQPQWIPLCPNMIPKDDPFRNAREKPVGVPEEFGDLSIIWIDMQIEQHIYQAMHSGAVDKEYGMKVIKQFNIDTTNVTTEFVDQEISCAIGTNSEGDITCILDTDNDENLGDEKPMIVKRTTIDSLKALHPNVTVMIDDLPTREVFFEYYTGQSTKIARQFICVNPTFMYGHDRIPVCQDQFVVNLSTYEFRTAQYEIDRKVYTFVVSNGFRPKMYSDNNTSLMVDVNDLGSFTSAKEGNKLYAVGDTLTLGKNIYRFENISVDGALVTLKIYDNQLK